MAEYINNTRKFGSSFGGMSGYSASDLADSVNNGVSFGSMSGDSDTDFGDSENSGAGIALLGAGVTMAGSILNNVLSVRYNREEAEKQRQWSEEMQRQQNAWNEEAWRKANEYNSPAAQVERLKEAGLNPLYYGIDGVPAAQLNAAQPIGYERASIPALVNPAESAISSAEQIARIHNIQADTAKKSNENVTETVRREQMLANIDLTKQQLQTELQRTDLTEAERKDIEKRLEWTDRLNQAALAKTESETKLNNSQRRRIDSLLEGEKLLQAKSIEDFEHKWSKIDAEIEKISAETGLAKEDLENYALNHMQAGMGGTGISFTNWLRFHNKERKKELNPVPQDGPPDSSGYSGIR